MPRDEWKVATDRAKYGPVKYAKKKAKKHRRDRVRGESGHDTCWVFLIHLRTPVIVIRPNGTEEEIETTKTLKFWKRSKEHSREGYCTFERRGFYLIVPNEHVKRDTIKVKRRK